MALVSLLNMHGSTRFLDLYLITQTSASLNKFANFVTLAVLKWNVEAVIQIGDCHTKFRIKMEIDSGL